MQVLFKNLFINKLVFNFYLHSLSVTHTHYYLSSERKQIYVNLNKFEK